MAVFILSRMRTVHSHTICQNKSFCLMFLSPQILTQKFILLNYLYSYKFLIKSSFVLQFVAEHIHLRCYTMANYRLPILPLMSVVDSNVHDTAINLTSHV